LPSGSLFSMGGGTYRFSKNIKLRGLSASSRSIMAMTSGTPTTSSSMLGFVDGSSMDYVKFENIDFTGYCDNNTSATKIGYLFNNNVLTTVKSLSFTNCKLHNYGNTTMRLQGGKAQKIDTLTYNGCVINESGFSSGYGLVNINKTADYIDNILISNSTLYNFSYPVISIVQTAANSMNSVIISNCTFNQTTQNTSSTRVLFTFDYMNITNGVTIKNCIFGSSGSVTAGLKITNSSTPASVITGCYYTSDYVDETLVGNVSYSIKSSMSSYSGLSTDLWTSPTTGDFTLKDTSFKGKGVAGDLRYY
jgi:hypothetical protein